MNNLSKSGRELALHSAEELCPMEYWIPYLKNFAINIVTKYHLRRHIGKKNTAESFWHVLIVHTMMNLSIGEASDQLNQIYLHEINRTRRNKIIPKRYKGDIPRRERIVPNGDQVRKYRNILPKWIINRLNTFIFDAQLAYAQENGLISNEILIIVDGNNMWYYGMDRFPKNPYINKSNKGPGTSRLRKYCAVMIKSGTSYLYVGVDIIRKGDSEMPFIISTIDRLILKDYHINHVAGDRWYPTYDFFAELEARSIHYIGPYKKYAPIKKIIVDYIEKGGKYICNYSIKGAPAKHYHSSPIRPTIILTNRQGRRLREIRADQLANKSTLDDQIKEIMVMVTTCPLPKVKKARQGWTVSICKRYEPRWQIETGFRDLNHITPPSNARTNERKYLMRSVQYWVYNA